ncbi:MAG: ImmA/IrrE family metallo-endopeptidase [Opitutales bacterium]
MAKKILTIGQDPGLRFEIALGSPAGRDASLAWGDLRLFLDDEAIWEGEHDSIDASTKPVNWTWIELLEYLGNWWPWLCLEENYPIAGVNPLYPSDIRKESEKRWVDLPQEIADAEEMAVYRYLLRHDLSSALSGCYLPSLLIKPQGEQCMLSSAALGKSVIRPKDEVIGTLTAVGDHLADYLKESSNVRARQALRNWRERMNRSDDVLMGILSGLSAAERESLSNGQAESVFWECDARNPFQDTEVLAAARMSKGIIPSGTQRLLLSRIKALAFHATPKLDRLSRDVSASFKEIGRPFEQGYWLAGWLRRKMKTQSESSPDLEHWLREWNIQILEESLPDGSIDALAVWGPRHGPAVLTNTTEPAKPAHPYGRRTTLAHEICHLLIDRERALPLGEVLGGNVAEHAEKRARAFAAELLLPRKLAEIIFRQSESLESAIQQMKEQYQVSEELIGWQLRNAAGLTLSADEATTLDRTTANYLVG